MKTKIFIVLLGLISFSLSAQLPSSLVAYYSFDNGDADIDQGTGGDGTENGTISYSCGYKGQAVYFNGNASNFIEFDNGLSSLISGTDDFTISFYVKPEDPSEIYPILSKRTGCSWNAGLELQTKPSAIANAAMMGGSQATLEIVQGNYPSTCWLHYTVVRDGSDFRLYINGVLLDTETLGGTNSINAVADFRLGWSPCIGVANEVAFEGYVDELMFFDDALTGTEINSLYDPTPITANIITDTTVCYFDSVFVELSSCVSSVAWYPSTGVSNPTSASTWVVPEATQTYVITGAASYGCDLVDTITITVDSTCCTPDTIFSVDTLYVNCDDGGPGGSKMGEWVEVNDTIVITDTLLISRNSVELVIPGSFTPNGDGRNDIFEIRGTGVTFLNMQVYDLWGRQVYSTYDSKAAWDGFYDGQPGQIGVYIYAIEYMIEETGTTQTRSGSFALIR